MIEDCSPGPHLELFARYPRPNWTVWGSEAAEDVTPAGSPVPDLSVRTRSASSIAGRLRGSYMTPTSNPGN
jgi:hypothetical protein